MNNRDELWDLIREGAPCPEPPEWFAARTLARLRQVNSRPLAWLALPRWLWAGGIAIITVVLVSTWQIHLNHSHDQDITFAALDDLASGDSPHNQEEAWFSSY